MISKDKILYYIVQVCNFFCHVQLVWFLITLLQFIYNFHKISIKTIFIKVIFFYKRIDFY